MLVYSLDKKIEILKKIGDLLSDKTFPKCKIGEDLDISILKTTDVIYDGISCGVYYSNSIFEKYKIEILQIWSKCHSFLSLNIVFGLGTKFLGKKGLYFFEIWNGEKVIYCLILVVNEESEIINDFYKGGQKEKHFNEISYYHVETPEINII